MLFLLTETGSGTAQIGNKGWLVATAPSQDAPLPRKKILFFLSNGAQQHRVNNGGNSIPRRRSLNIIYPRTIVFVTVLGWKRQ